MQVQPGQPIGSSSANQRAGGQQRDTGASSRAVFAWLIAAVQIRATARVPGETFAGYRWG